MYHHLHLQSILQWLSHAVKIEKQHGETSTKLPCLKSSWLTTMRILFRASPGSGGNSSTSVGTQWTSCTLVPPAMSCNCRLVTLSVTVAIYLPVNKLFSTTTTICMDKKIAVAGSTIVLFGARMVHSITLWSALMMDVIPFVQSHLQKEAPESLSNMQDMKTDTSENCFLTPGTALTRTDYYNARREIPCTISSPSFVISSRPDVATSSLPTVKSRGLETPGFFLSWIPTRDRLKRIVSTRKVYVSHRAQYQTVVVTTVAEYKMYKSVLRKRSRIHIKYKQHQEASLWSWNK